MMEAEGELGRPVHNHTRTYVQRHNKNRPLRRFRSAPCRTGGAVSCIRYLGGVYFRATSEKERKRKGRALGAQNNGARGGAPR
jgi:hypothetical protein